MAGNRQRYFYDNVTFTGLAVGTLQSKTYTAKQQRGKIIGIAYVGALTSAVNGTAINTIVANGDVIFDGTGGTLSYNAILVNGSGPDILSQALRCNIEPGSTLEFNVTAANGGGGQAAQFVIIYDNEA